MVVVAEGGGGRDGDWRRRASGERERERDIGERDRDKDRERDRDGRGTSSSLSLPGLGMAMATSSSSALGAANSAPGDRCHNGESLCKSPYVMQSAGKEWSWLGYSAKQFRSFAMEFPPALDVGADEVRVYAGMAFVLKRRVGMVCDRGRVGRVVYC